MNKKFAAFLFALGMGVTLAAKADACMAYCQNAKMQCLNAAGSDTAAQAVCMDNFLACADNCSTQ